MNNIEKIVRRNILELRPYSSARDEFSDRNGIFLDANENPFGELNRYPDPYQKELKQKLAEMRGVDTKNIFVGNGSDEVIDLAFRIFCYPGIDKALTFTPTYGIYEVSAAINNVEIVNVPLHKAFQIDLEKTKPYLNDKRVKLIFICSPNNPTGNLMNKKEIEFILNNANGIVIIDKAYIDFSNETSTIALINQYKNLIVSQTMSKAWGLAAARIGIAYANEQIISLYNKVKSPYNVSELNQKQALKTLNNYDLYSSNLRTILDEKEQLKMALQQINVVKKVYPSDANFLLIEVDNSNEIYSTLVNQKIITRNRNKQVPNCIRISVGTPDENRALITALKELR